MRDGRAAHRKLKGVVAIPGCRVHGEVTRLQTAPPEAVRQVHVRVQQLGGRFDGLAAEEARACRGHGQDRRGRREQQHAEKSRRVCSAVGDFLGPRRVPRDLAMRCLALLLSMLAAPTCGLRLGSVSRCNAPVAALAASPATVDPATLPGDPSLILTTNVKLSDKKAFMTAASAAIASSLSKPESYVAVAVTDSQDLIFGGSDAPCALGCGEPYLGLAERPGTVAAR